MGTQGSFVIHAKRAAKESGYVRLAPETWRRLEQLEKKSGVPKAEIMQQAIDFALERLEIK